MVVLAGDTSVEAVFAPLAVDEEVPLKITAFDLEGTEFILRWASAPGVAYWVEATNDLSAADWSRVVSVTADNAETQAVLAQDIGIYFRVRLVETN